MGNGKVHLGVDDTGRSADTSGTSDTADTVDTVDIVNARDSAFQTVILITLLSILIN